MLNTLKKDIDKELAEFLRSSSIMMSIKRSSPVLYKGIKDFIRRPGKRIRPILVVIGYLGYTKRKKPDLRGLIRSSLSMELLHDFLLIHDDIIDNSETRRGKPSLHRLFNTKYGAPPADKLGSDLGLIAGDIVFAAAIKELLSIKENPVHINKAVSILADIAAQTGLGEYLDVINDSKGIDAITEQDILSMYTLKTAKYTFEGPLLIGSSLAGANNIETGKISKLGSFLGQAFQLQDDLLDIFLSSKDTGKPAFKDLDESKRTLLIRETYARSNNTSRKRMQSIFNKKIRLKKTS